VGWASYHDQWLSEGFAEFATGLFLEEAVGPKWQKDYLELFIAKQDSVGKGGVGSGCTGSWDSTKITGFSDHGHYRKSSQSRQSHNP
jgi:hypothetical protein